jgi:uncharacterized membrane protein
MGTRLSGKTINPLLKMPRITSIAILVVGIILLVYGLDASGSFSSSVSRAVSGTPTDKTVWLIALGVVGVIAGGFGLVFRKAP